MSTPPAGGSARGATWVLRSTPDFTPACAFRLRAGSIKTLGRAVRADFNVDAPLLSRLHCRLTALLDGRLEVEDLDSTNGTFLNGRRVQRAFLVPGDRLRAGRLELTVERNDTGQVSP